MIVRLTPELKAFVNGKVEAGIYASAGDGVRLLEAYDRAKAQRFARLCGDLRQSLDELNRGEPSRCTVADIKRLAREKAASSPF